MSQTLTEKAATIRKTLKATLGASARDVAVRCSAGCSIDVTIRNAGFRISDVEAIAMAHEQIDYCAVSGEILSGGNTFVRVEYSDEALAPIVAELRATFDAGEKYNDVELYEADGYWHTANAPQVFGARSNVRCWGRDYAIRQLAIIVANQERRMAVAS